MTDPRYRLIAEAMEARGKATGGKWIAMDYLGCSDEEWEVIGQTAIRVTGCVASDVSKRDARSIALSHNALPVAVELIEDLTAKLRRSRVMVEAQTADIERCERAIVREEVRAQKAEARVRELEGEAKEIEHYKKRVTQLLDEAADADEAEERLLDKCNYRIEQVNEQAKEIERLRAYWLRHKAPDEVSP